MSVQPPDPEALTPDAVGVPSAEPLVDEAAAPRPRRRRRRVLSVLGSLVLATAVTAGVLVTLDVREERALAAAAEKERRASEAYRRAVAPLAVRVFDAVQPIQDAEEAFAKPQFGLLGAHDDVILRTGVLEELAAVVKRLDGLPVPDTHRQDARVLRTSLGTLRAAVARLGRAVRAPIDTFGYNDEHFDAHTSFVGSMGVWAGAVSRVDAKGVMPVPTAGRAASRGRSVPTRGGFVHGSDMACARAVAADARLPKRSPRQELLVNMPKRTAALRTALQQLARVPVPASAKPFRSALSVHLRAATELGRTLDRLSMEVRQYDQEGARKAVQDVYATFSSLRTLSAQYRKIGATMCGDYFDPGEDKRPQSRRA